MSRYSEWVASQHFPVTLSAEKQQALEKKLSQLQIGMTREQVIAQAGKPDYVGDASLQTGSVACLWVYSFIDQSPDTPPQDKRLVVVGFTSEGRVALLAPNKVSGVHQIEMNDESCEPKRLGPDSPIDQALDSSNAYVASSERQKQIRTNYPNLAVGMTIAQVETLLGSPDSVSAFHKGHIGGVVPVGEPCKRQLVYILKQSTKNPIDPDTAAIYLSFDEKARLYWGAPQNVDGLKQVGTPDEHKGQIY